MLPVPFSIPQTTLRELNTLFSSLSGPSLPAETSLPYQTPRRRPTQHKHPHALPPAIRLCRKGAGHEK